MCKFYEIYMILPQIIFNSMFEYKILQMLSVIDQVSHNAFDVIEEPMYFTRLL